MEWRTANDHVVRLQQSEPAFADNPRISPLPIHVEPLVATLLKSKSVEKFFSIAPITIGIVELDRLVVYQKHINLTYIRDIQSSIPKNPSLEELLCICLPESAEKPPVGIGRVSNSAYVFSSISNDLRFLDALQVDGVKFPELSEYGTKTIGVLLVVGYGPNLLSAIKMGNRLILQNGNHRAFALRELGITHVPCIIEHISRHDELEIVAAGELLENSERYFNEPRPPVLRDYFDPNLRKLCRVKRNIRQVKISYGVDATNVPA